MQQEAQKQESGDSGKVTFGGEVEGCSSATGSVAPVDCALAVAVLVVVQHAICVLAGVPKLSKSQLRHSCVYVLPCELPTCKQTALSFTFGKRTKRKVR